MTTALLTDRYELTMVEAALRSGRADRECVFEVFGRRLPGERRYGVLAGTGRALEAITAFRFGTAELDWLANEHVVGDETLRFLADYRFTGSIEGYREGEIYVPGSPLLTVQSTFAQAVMLETVVLSVLNYDSAVATAAARMVSAAEGHPLAEMGSRRAHESAAVAAARAAYIAGFGATSNLEAGRRWGVPTMGTAAHSFTLLHDSEEDAFRAQVDALGADTTLLVDTYDVARGVETAVRVAGPQLGAVRLDSGDLPSLVREVRAQLDALGASNTRITVTSDLDEHRIAALRGSPADAFGVGTAVSTGSGNPAAGFVYKLVARRDADGTWMPVAKSSAGKASIGGRKRAVRVLQNGVAVEERITVIEPDSTSEQKLAGTTAGEVAHVRATGLAHDSSERQLTVTLMTDGEAHPDALGIEGTRRARDHCATAVAELPQAAFRLSRGEPAFATVYA